MFVNVESTVAPLGQDLVQTLKNQFVQVHYTDGRMVGGIAIPQGDGSLVSVGGWVTLSRNDQCYLPIDTISVFTGHGEVEVWSKEMYDQMLHDQDPKNSDYYVSMLEDENMWQCGDCHAFWPMEVTYCPNEEIDELVVAMKHVQYHLDNPSLPCRVVPEKAPCAYERVYVEAMNALKKQIDQNVQHLFNRSIY